jgi:cytochrome b
MSGKSPDKELDVSKNAASERGLSGKLWDLPTRLFHWSLVVLIIFSWWTHPDHMDWHRLSGLAILGLLVFRIIWGFVGATTARFAQFVRGPRETVAYLRRMFDRKAVAGTPGHNPIGAWSVLLMVGLLCFQVISGLFAVDVDGIESGPLSDRVDFDTGRWFSQWHETSFTILQILVALHVAAILFYLFYKRTNLVTPMLTGRARSVENHHVTFSRTITAIVAAVFAATFAWWASTGFRF